MTAEQPSEETVLAEGWGQETDDVLKRSGASKWLKLEDGDTANINVIGKPVVFEKDFGRGPTTRIRVGIYNLDADRDQEWEMSKKTFELLKRQRGKRAGDFGNAVFELVRNGVGTSTTYILDYSRQLTPEEQEKRAFGATADAGPTAANPEDMPF